MTTIRWLYCYECLFDHWLVPLKYDFERELALCPICGYWLTGEYLYILLRSTRQ